jgi:hypothetical protein
LPNFESQYDIAVKFMIHSIARQKACKVALVLLPTQLRLGDLTATVSIDPSTTVGGSSGAAPTQPCTTPLCQIHAED